MEPKQTMMIEPEHTPALTERNPAPFHVSLLATTNIPVLGITFREAADQTRALLGGYPAVPDDESAQEAQGREWQRLHDAILAAPAETFGDLLAKVERMACPHIGMRNFHLKEVERGVLEQDVERLRSHLTAGASADAEIFAAFDRWADLVRDCCAAKADEDVERLSEQADEAALDVMTYEPTTPEGLAAQVYVMLHLERGGTAADRLDIDLSTAGTPDDGAHARAVHALLERVRRIGRPDASTAEARRLGGELARAADSRAGAYQLPEEVSRAMQAVCARNVAESAKAEIRNPGPGEELRNTFRRLEEQDRKSVMALAPFMAVSAHLNDAMLNVAREHGVIRMHRAWLEGHLADIPAEGSAVTEGSRLQERPASEELQQAWGELVALDAQVETLPAEGLENGAYDAIVERSRAAARRVLIAPAHTVGDLEILAKLALRSLIFYFGVDEAQVRAWFTDGDLPGDDERDSLAALWRVAKGLRNLSDATPDARVPVANDQHQDADAFADTITVFEAEAPATLAVPLEPTGRMVDAGASAAGITPAQFQAAYAAAVEALKLERAA